MCFEILQIATIWSRACRWKDEIVLAPDDESGRLILPEEGLKLRIEGHVSSVREEEIHLYVQISWTVQPHLIQSPRRWIEQCLVCHSGFILPLGRLLIDQKIKCLPILRRGISPILLYRIPEFE